MDSLDFSEDEIQEQLAVLGYRNIPQHRLREFKRDLDELIQQKKLKILDSSSELNFSNRSPLVANHTTTSPPAYTKETGPQCFPSWSGEGSILNAGTGDHNREVLSSWHLNQELDHQDSYARYTVAPRILRPSEAPHRLHVLPDPGTHESDPGSDRLSHPTSQASSPEGGSQGKPFITRKVLRKHKGQFFVCNESVHSEDSEPSGRLLLRPATLSFSAWATMYKLCPGADEESSGNDRSSLHSSSSSSFWSDGEEEQEVVERAGREEGLAAAPGSVSAPLNPAVTSADPPPARQWESRCSSHGSVEEEDGDDEDGSEDEDSVADEVDVEGYEDGSDDEDSGSDEDGGGDKDVGSDDEDSGAVEDDDVSVDDEVACGGRDDEDNDGDDADDGGVSDSVEDEDGGDKAPAGENPGSPAPSHLTSGYGTYRPDSASKDTEAGTIAEFDGETLAGEESDEEDLYRFYCGDPSPPPHLQPPRSMPRSPDPSEALSGMGHRSQPGLEEEEWRGGEDRKCPVPDRKSSADQREYPPPPQAGVSERFPWRSEGDEHRSGSALEEHWTDRQDQEQEPEQEQELGEFYSNTEIRFIDSHLEPGCAGALWDSLGPRDQDVSGLEERLGGLRMATASAHCHGDDGDEETENEDIAGQSDDITSQSDGRSSSGLSLTAFESFVRDMVRMQTESALKPRPKSFIRPALGHPHTRNLKKMDPLTRYLQYKQEWDMFKVPGEKDRKALRWEIREQLAYQAPPARPRRAYVPNSYIVPTDKKRSALRWEVRNDLANGLLPPKQNYRF